MTRQEAINWLTALGGKYLGDGLCQSVRASELLAALSEDNLYTGIATHPGFTKEAAHAAFVYGVGVKTTPARLEGVYGRQATIEVIVNPDSPAAKTGTVVYTMDPIVGRINPNLGMLVVTN